MPFGPMNAPATYTAMMFIMKTEYDTLFHTRYPDSWSKVGGKIIMDDGLLWAKDDPMLALHYFRCVCKVFTKYQVSFNPKKCDFFKQRFEWLGNDLLPDGNHPASSKFNLINDWPHLATGISLSSFIGLITFYSRYIPHTDIKLCPLRHLAKLHHCKSIPDAAWTNPLSTLFDKLKVAITSDPCLARFNLTIPIFLKTDWSNVGMSFVLMQPADDDASHIALAILQQDNSLNTFDELMSGA